MSFFNTFKIFIEYEKNFKNKFKHNQRKIVC